MATGAFVDYYFDKKGFILDEERLRKIQSIICQRATDLPGNPVPIYSVYRSDNFYFDTYNLDEILNEDNLDWQRIITIRVYLDYKKGQEKKNEEKEDVKQEKIPLGLKLEFNQGSTLLRLSGEDRDLVFLLYSELKQYIESQVCVLSKLNPSRFRELNYMIAILFFMAGFVSMLIPIFYIKSPSAIDQLLAKGIEEKVNYLVQRTYATLPFPPTISIILFVIGLIIFLPPAFLDVENFSKLLKKISPQYYFLIGKEINRYNQRKTTMQNVKWGIIIAFIISVVAGFFVELF